MTVGDVDGILQLLRDALGEPPLLKRTPELFAWKHFDNPSGESIARVALVDGRIVGLRAFMRWDLVTPSGDRLRCVRAVDTATHPDYHRRGIFRRLTEEAIETARADGVDLVFNTPNERSGAGYLSMGWSLVGSIGAMIRPSRRIFSSASSNSADDFLDTIVPFSSPDVHDREPLGLRTPRTERYLSWRFAHPTARYFVFQIDNSMAVVRPNIRRNRRELLLVDVIGPEPASAVRECLGHSRAGYVATWFSKGSPERRASIRCGLFPVPRARTLTLMARPLRELDHDVSSMDSWDLAISDLELL